MVSDVVFPGEPVENKLLNAGEIIEAIARSELPVTHSVWGGKYFASRLENGEYTDEEDGDSFVQTPCGCPLTQLALSLHLVSFDWLERDKTGALALEGYYPEEIRQFVWYFDSLATNGGNRPGFDRIKEWAMRTNAGRVALEVYNWCIENIPASRRSF